MHVELVTRPEPRQKQSTMGANGNASNSNAEQTDQKTKSLTFPGKVVVFFLFPMLVGLAGMLAVYLDKSDPDRKLRIERDFALPFSITLLLTVVVGLQTNGFSSKPQPLVRWPKVRKQRRVRHVHVVKGQDLSAVDVDSEEKELEDKKND